MTIFDLPDDSRDFLPSELEDYGMCPTHDPEHPPEYWPDDEDEPLTPPPYDENEFPPLSATPT